MSSARMSKAMFQALHDGIVHGCIAHSISGRSASGGFTGTRAALIRNGWVDHETDEVTDAGRAIYADVSKRHRPFPYDISHLSTT